MPTIFSHAVLATTAGYFFRPPHSKAFWILTAGCAMLPDLDVVGLEFGVPYGSVFGHRGITHSLLFAIVLGLLISLHFREKEWPKWKLAIYFSVVTFSHPVLDMLTDGGMGVALLAPFSNERFFLPWRPIEVSPIGLNFFSPRGFEVAASELMWIMIPCAVVFAILLLIRRQ